MSRRDRTTRALLAVAAAACCPTLWLGVSRDEPAALPDAGPAIVEEGTIPEPPVLANRFDKLACAGKLGREGAAFSDRLDRTRTSEELQAALVARAHILQRCGDGTLPVDALVDAQPGVPARVRCPSGECRVLGIDGPLPWRPAIARVSTGDGAPPRTVAVRGCEAPTGAGPVACDQPTEAGLHVRLEGGLDGLADDTPVTVVFAGALEVTRPLLSFVQLSDVQLREHHVKLGDPDASARIDRWIPSFEYDPDQELYGPYLLEAVVATINGEVRARKMLGVSGMVPRFVLHTGDAIDAGTMNELQTFHRIMDRLALPWLDVLGNHDVMMFGNMLPAAAPGSDHRCVTMRSVAEPYIGWWSWTVPNKLCALADPGAQGTDHDFVARPDPIESRERAIREHAAQYGDHYHLSTRRKCDDLLELDDRYHGFDPGSPRGHYAFAVPLERVGAVDRDAIFVVLNTEDLLANVGGNRGQLREEQVEWLERVLRCPGPRDVVFLVGHHGPHKLMLPGGKPFDAHPLPTPNVAAFLYGHNHEHGVCRRAGGCPRGFWEIEAASLAEFPQEGRLVRVKTLGGGLAFLEVASFRERLAGPAEPFAALVEKARRGAERDRCRQRRPPTCRDGKPVRKDAAHASVRLFFRLP